MELTREQKDKGMNRQADDFSKLCTSTGLRIINGRLGKDEAIRQYMYRGKRHDPTEQESDST